MIDFTKSAEARQRQNSVSVMGTEYAIHTEFYWWVLFGRMIIKDHTYGDYDIFYKNDVKKEKGGLLSRCEKLNNPPSLIPDDRESGFNELIKFYKNEQPLPHDTGEKTDIIGVDWKIDSEYIRAAFLEKYRIDLLTTDCHWHDFLALFHALKDTAINDIMSARYYTDKKSKKDPFITLKEKWELVMKKPIAKGKKS
jgi:hypothetical protein